MMCLASLKAAKRFLLLLIDIFEVLNPQACYGNALMSPEAAPYYIIILES